MIAAARGHEHLDTLDAISGTQSAVPTFQSSSCFAQG
jgi:hypothetical protein